MCLYCWHDNLSQHFTVNDFVRSAISINVLSPVLYAVAVAAAEKHSRSTSEHTIEDFQPAHLREDGNLLRSFNPIIFCLISCFPNIITLYYRLSLHNVCTKSCQTQHHFSSYKMCTDSTPHPALISLAIAQTIMRTPRINIFNSFSRYDKSFRGSFT